MAKLSMSDFPLERFIVEIRFADGLLHWDRAGHLWRRVRQRRPEFAVVNGEPAKTVFQIPGKWECSCGIEQASFAALGSAEMRDSISEAAAFFTDVVTELELSTLTRIGCRQNFAQQCESGEAAAKVIIDLGLTKNPGAEMFGITAGPLNQLYSVRFEEPTKGITIRVEAQGRKVDFTPAFGVPGLNPVSAKFDVVLLDVDYFSQGTIPIGSLRFGDWISDAVTTVQTNLPKFLG